MSTEIEREPEIHHAHRDVTGGWVRPATFGMMDGLVSNLALLAGVIGGGAATHTQVLTGLAGLVAGACSMAVGEYTSVSSQSELIRAEIATEKRELAENPDEELAELTLVYRSKGLHEALAAQVARELTRDSRTAWRVHAREELGVDPDDLPSPWVAAVSSFLSFALGAFVPIIPLLFGGSSLVWVAVVSAVGLFCSGAVVSRLTATPMWFGGGRQLVLGTLAAAVTFGIGTAVGGAGLA
jgi:VIT1/CCC1 family predicted Fe2+/Mn2+ transporter